MSHTYKEKENGIIYHTLQCYDPYNWSDFSDKHKWTKICVCYDVDAVSEPFVLTYYKDGKIHNEFGPAIITMDGILNKTENYYLEGQKVTKDKINQILRKKKLNKIGINT